VGYITAACIAQSTLRQHGDLIIPIDDLVPSVTFYTFYPCCVTLLVPPAVFL